MDDLKNALEKAGCIVTSQEYQEILDEFQFHPGQVMDFEGFKEVLLCKEYLRFFRRVSESRFSNLYSPAHARTAQIFTEESYYSKTYCIQRWGQRGQSY